MAAKAKAAKAKVAKACRAMNALGYTAEIVKPVLKNLLELYDQNWKLIEEEKYAVLVDAILDSEEKKGEEKKRKEFCSLDDPAEGKLRAKRYKLRSHTAQSFSSSPSSPSPNQTTGLELPEKILPSSNDSSDESDPAYSFSLVPRKRKSNATVMNIVSYEEKDVSHYCDLSDEKDEPDKDHQDVGRETELMPDELSGFEAPETTITPVAGTLAADDEAVRLAKGQSALVVHKDYQSQDTLDGSINYQHGFCIAPNLSSAIIRLQNLFEIRPGISRFKSLYPWYLTFCKIDSSMERAYDKNDIKIEKTEGLEYSSSSSMMIVQRQHFATNMHTPSYFVADVSRGEEKLKIPLMNEINSELQPVFRYIPRNITYHQAYVKFPLAHISEDSCCFDCSGDCLSSDIPCACAGETDGKFAYAPGGLVKEKFLEDCIAVNRNPQRKDIFYCNNCPLGRSKGKRYAGKCKGHLVRKFIKECWYKCGCNKSCGNRVVQRGIAVGLEVFMTPEGKGWGLRTLKELPKGAFVCEYVGEIVTNMELFERNMKNTREKHTYPVLLDADWCTEGVLKDEKALCLDATFYGNVARFINHRCYDANLVEIPIEMETSDHHYYHLAFFTRRKINAFEELTWDYGIDFNDLTHPVKAFRCRCESEFCRDIKPEKG